MNVNPYYVMAACATVGGSFMGGVLIWQQANGIETSAPDTTVDIPISTEVVSQIGPAGPQGPPGPQGPVGPQGEPGVGEVGATGESGPAGPPGLDGAVGPRGNPGGQGAQGQTGETGATGATGATGEPGPAGDTGSQGETGPPGEAGQPGVQGEPGVPGVPGAVGPIGPIGPIGPPGPTPPTIRGVVVDGVATSGTGYTIAPLTNGRYQINFDVPFPTIPALLVTKIFGSPTVDAGPIVQARENAIVDFITESTAIIALSDDNGNLTAGSFSFVAVGDTPP